jgi:hypothetical protein
MQDKEKRESKVWFRFLKVVYVFAYALAALSVVSMSVGVAVEEYIPKKVVSGKHVQCKNGEVFDEKVTDDSSVTSGGEMSNDRVYKILCSEKKVAQIQIARFRGTSDAQILQEYQKQNPEKQSAVQEAFQRGATAQQIVDEIIQQNQGATIVPAASDKWEPLPKNYEITLSYKTVGSWEKAFSVAIAGLVIGLVIVFLIFEAIKRVFLYIVFGTKIFARY